MSDRLEEIDLQLQSSATGTFDGDASAAISWLVREVRYLRDLNGGLVATGDEIVSRYGKQSARVGNLQDRLLRIERIAAGAE